MKKLTLSLLLLFSLRGLSGATPVQSMVVNGYTGALVDPPAQDFYAANPPPSGQQSVSVAAYGAVGDGLTGDAFAIQAAINDQASRGGGAVLLGVNKQYVIDSPLSVPAGVTLQGSEPGWHRTPAEIGSLTDQPISSLTNGSVLLIKCGAGGGATDPAAVTVHALGTIRDLSIYHPDQATSGTPVAYPFAVRLDQYGANAIDLDLVNPYRGIEILGGRCVVRGINGDPLALGIRIDAVQDVTRVSDVHFVFSWSAAHPEIYAWRKAHGVGFEIGRADLLYMRDCFLIYYDIGYKLVVGFGGAGAYGTATRCSADLCNYGIRDYGTQPSAQMQWTNSDFAAFINTYKGDAARVGSIGLYDCVFRNVGSGSSSNVESNGASNALFRLVNGTFFASSGPPVTILGQQVVDIRGNQIVSGNPTFTIDSACISSGQLGRNYNGGSIAPIANPGGNTAMRLDDTTDRMTVIGAAEEVPATSGSGPNWMARIRAPYPGSRVLDSGIDEDGAWLQSRSSLNYGINYPLLLNPNGGRVEIPYITATLGGTTTLGPDWVGNQIVCYGTVSNYTVTLPAASACANKSLHFLMEQTGLTKIVTLASASLIDGLATRAMHNGETAVLLSDGTTWRKVAGRSIALSVTLRRTTSVGIGGGWTPVPVFTLVAGSPLMFDGGNGRPMIARDGAYDCRAFAAVSGGGVGLGIERNTAGSGPAGPANGYGPFAGGAGGAAFSSSIQCNAGDFLYLTILGSGSGTTSTATGSYPQITVTEQVSW